MLKARIFLFGGVMIALIAVVVGLHKYNNMINRERRQCYCALVEILEESRKTSNDLYYYLAGRYLPTEDGKDVEVEKEFMFPLEWSQIVADALINAIETCPRDVQPEIYEQFPDYRTVYGHLVATNITSDQESRIDFANLAHTAIGRAINKTVRALETFDQRWSCYDPSVE